MLDLTKIEKPFFLLDNETRVALKAHFDDGGVIELLADQGWGPAPHPRFCGSSTYRAKPQTRVFKAKYGVGKVWSDKEPPSILATNFRAPNWRTMTGEIVVGDDGWPVSITLKREGAA